MLVRRNWLKVPLACAAAWGLASGAWGQSTPAYPNKPVKLIVPFAPGGFTDVVARILGQELSAAMGQNFIIENKAGAGSTIGTDLVAKAAPDTVHYASSGNGSAQHLMGGLFVAMTGAPLKHVPYRGSAGATTDLVAGVVQSSFAGVPNALSQVPQGRLKALAVTTAKRIPQLPDIPTMQEAGVAGYDASVWLALLAPAGTPREIVMKLNAEIVRLMASPETVKALADAGVEVAPSSPEVMAAYMQQELERWGKVVKETGVNLE